MTGLAEFLLQRIAEDEARLRKRDDYPSGRVHWPADCDYPGDEPHGLCTCTLHAQLLAECDAKRRIIELAFVHAAMIDGEWGCVHTAEQIRDGKCAEEPPDNQELLRLLALPYAGDPGYREEWRP